MATEIRHYKVRKLPLNPFPNSVYYVLEELDGNVKTYITDLYGTPIALIDENTQGVLTLTGTGVTGTSTHPIVNISTFVSDQLNNQVYLSSEDGKLQVNPLVSPDLSLSIVSTSNELQIQLATSIANVINSALQPGDNISLLVNDSGYLKIADLPNTKSEYNSSLTDGDFLFVGDITQYTDEQAQDAVGNILVDSTTIDFTYNDSTPSITAIVKPNSITSTELANNINISEFINDSGYELTSNKGVANGYPSLDSGGKIPVSQLPNSVMEYKGVYNASTNTPTLVNGVGDTGDVYRVTVAGSGVNGLGFVVGDFAIYNGTTWEKSHSGADNVNSVFGRAGAVVAVNGDYTTALVPDTLNKRYVTDANLVTIGNQSGINTGDNSVNTNSNAYADSKVEDLIVDGVTTKAPSQNSVFDALDVKTGNSAGAIQGFAITNNGNGTVNIATGTAYLRATNDQYAPLLKYTIPAVTNLALTDNANNYILVDYNGGSPALTVTTNSATINTETNSLAIVISRVGTILDYLSLVGQNNDPNAKIRVRFLNQEGIRRANGAIIGFANRNLTLTAGTLFSGLIRINSPAFNTASPDTFTYVYNNGVVWTRVTGQTQIDNTQYNNTGVLTVMPNNDFRTDYIYLLPNNPSKLYVVYGNATYNSITLARTAPTPTSLPSELQVLGVLVGRQIIQKNALVISEVSSAFSDVFVNTGVPEHNSLAGLQGGAVNDYQHLTTTEKNNILHKTGDTFLNSTDFDPLLSQEASTLTVKKRDLLPESMRLSTAYTLIYGWGDSLTAGSGGSGTTYLTALAGLTNFTVTNKGVPGETSTQIKDRFLLEPANFDKSVIIWAGRNNFASAATVKADIATMISSLGHTRYLVVSILNGDYGIEYKNAADWVKITTLNNDLKTLYGSRYVELREYLVSLHDNSAQDLLDFSHDVPPTSLRSDAIHLNAAGYTKVAEFLNQRLGVLFGFNGYLQSKDFAYYNNLYSSNSILNQASVTQTGTFRISGLGILSRTVTRFGTSNDLSSAHHILQSAGGSNRVSLNLLNTESGSNLGSDLGVVLYNDAGTSFLNPLTIFRDTGEILIKGTGALPVRTGFMASIAGSFRANSINIGNVPATATAFTQALFRNPSTATLEVANMNTLAILNQTASVQVGGFRVDGLGIMARSIVNQGTAADFSKIHYMMQSGASNRFSANLTGTESGGNIGSDYSLVGYNDTGTAINNPLTIFRNSGNTVLKGTNALAVDAGYRLDVFGNIRTDGTFTFSTQPTTSAGTYDIITRNTTTGVIEKVLDSSFLHSSTNEPFTGIKSSTNTGATQINGFSLTNDGTSAQVLAVVNNNAGVGARFTNSSTGTAAVITNQASGNGLSLTNQLSGVGVRMFNQGTGILNIWDSSTASTGDLLQFRKNNVITTTVDQNGLITSQQFILSAPNVASANIQTGSLKMVDVGSTRNNLTLTANANSPLGANIRLEVLDPTAHIGFNRGGTANSALAFLFDETNNNGHIDFRGVNYINVTDTDQYSRLGQNGNDFEYRNIKSGAFLFKSAGGGTTNVRINNNGNVGIGGVASSTAPLSKFHVDGGDISIGGTAIGGVRFYNTASAERANLLFTGTSLDLNTLTAQPINFKTNNITTMSLSSSGILSLTNSPVTSVGTYDFISRNTSTGQVEKIPSASVQLTTTGVKSPIRTITATATALVTDYTLLCDATSGAITLNLPAAASFSGVIFCIKKINNTANNITIDPNGVELIEFASTLVISTYLQSVIIQSNGTSWFVIN